MLTSPNDHRSYRYLTLENGLRVLLAEDPQATKSAAAIAVNIGHFNDPVDRPGMSHLLEHMLFLGTKKYPEADDYQKFIATHGGNHNGWTGTEHSCYFFDIEHQHLLPALDRFAQFFIQPLLDKRWLEKERQSIDAEYRMKIKDDVRRLFQAQKETINPAHPFSRFSVGNLETLADRANSEIATELKQYFADNYHAGNMTLCLLSPLPLAEQRKAIEQFAHIASGVSKAEPVTVPMYRTEDQMITLLVKPQKSVRKLILSFALPEIDSSYSTKPINFLSHLLGDEGKSSLLAQLKDLGWVSSMTVGGGINGSNFKDFNIDFLLTEVGLNHVVEIVEYAFALIKEVEKNGLQHWRYDEKRQLTELAFRFQEKGRPIDLVSHLAVNMQHYPEQDIIYGDYRMDGLDLPHTQQLLALLKPENMRLYIIAPEVNTDIEAKLYFTQYSVVPFDEQMVARWQTPQLTLRSNALPPPNPFLTEAVEPHPIEQLVPYPQKLINKPHFRLWHKQEDKFHVPKGHLYLSVDSPFASRTAAEIAMLRLAVEMILDNLSAITYPAEIAGLNYHIYAHQCGVTLHLAGFTGKQQLLLEILLQQLYQPKFSQQQFIQLKSQLIRHWRNAEKNRPVSQLFSELAAMLQPANPGPRRLADEMEAISLEQLCDYVDKFKRELHLEVLIYGDWLAKEAKKLGNWIEERLFSDARPGKGCPRELINIGGLGPLHRQLEVPHNDAALVIYYQSAVTSANEIALFLLVNHLISSPFFHELRTEKQLGYMVGTGYLPMQRHPGLVLYLQSPNNSVTTLLSAVDEFLVSVPHRIEQMSNEEWQYVCHGLISQVLEPDNNLRTLAQRYWVSIGNKDFDFSQRELVAENIRKLDKATLIRFASDKLIPEGSDRLVLFSQGEQKGSLPDKPNVTQVEDLTLFKTHGERFVLY